MRKLEAKDLWPLPVYEGVRDQFRREVIAAKELRRVSVGPSITFVFENRLTVKFQVQEILRAERIAGEEQVREELDGFNTMLPGPGELSATLLIELFGSDAQVKAALARLTGLGDHLWLEIAGQRIRGAMEGGRDDGRRVSAVQYVRFSVPDGAALQRGPAALLVDHPAYTHRQELSEAVRAALARDLVPEGS
ncbi:MAG TPA: DUF3501 family protein [Myxococcales bacterium]|jgi:hypothetical protein|nr:DUF3501 family protein [Myxococcales bacterium]